jgi:hypothetical protein
VILRPGGHPVAPSDLADLYAAVALVIFGDQLIERSPNLFTDFALTLAAGPPLVVSGG